MKTHPTPQPRHGLITWRTILLSLLLLPFIYRWHIECEALRHTFPTLMAPFYSVVFTLFILALLNLPLKKFAAKYALTSGELIAFYVLMSMMLVFMSYDMFLALVSIIVHAFWFASPENEWRNLFWGYLPDWLTIRDRDVLRAFHLGGESIFSWRYLRAWAKPTFWWCTFTFVLLFVMQCINVIIRKQWVEDERLAYPIVQLPYELAINTSSFLTSKPMWCGFAIAAFISLINGLHILYPEIPSIPNKYIPLHSLFTEKPWSALRRDGFAIIIYPFAVGLGFLMPLDLLLSCAFFFCFYKAQYVIGSIIGVDNIPGYPYRFEQNIGAYTGACVLALWGTRRQFWYAFLQSMGRRRAGTRETPLHDDETEPMRYRTAFLGITFGGIFLIGFTMRGGMAPWIAALFFAAYFTIALTLTRIRAEIGFPLHSTSHIGPHKSLVSLLGTRRIGAQSLTWFSLFLWFNRDNRNHPMPHQLEAFKLAERGNLDVKRLSRWMLALIVIAMPLCILMLLDTFFKLGVDSGKVIRQIRGHGRHAYGFLQSWLTSPRDANTAHIIAMTIGFVFTLLLAVVRSRLFWWPIHPLGYGVSFHMHLLWAAFFISCIAKWLVLKYGGIGMYRKAVPFFLGLVLGDFVIGSFWNILSIILNTPTYTFYY